MNRRITAVGAALALGLASAATQARKLSDVDVLATSNPVRPTVSASSARALESLVRTGKETQVHERFSVPTFLWASRSASEAGLSAARASMARKSGVSA